MKRPRSYEEELDADPDRHHRRFYPKPKAAGACSSSSSYDRSIDEDRDSSRSLRRSFDRHRYGGGSGGGRQMPVSPSPLPGGDRMHRSESFSMLRRDFPKGFRSERSRRDRSWQPRSSSERESESAANLDGNKHRRHRSRERSRESSRVDIVSKREEKVNRESSCSSSEMEEGELEPDPVEPEPEAELENLKTREIEGASSEKEEIVSVEKKLESNDDDGDGNDDDVDDTGLNDQGAQEKVEDVGNLGEEKKESSEEVQGKVEEDKGASPPPAAILEEKQENVEDSRKTEEADVGLSVDDDVEKKEGRVIDLEAEPEDDTVLRKEDEGTLELMMDKPLENHKDKGKSVAISCSNNDDSVDVEDPGEGPSSRRGFELFFLSDTVANSSAIVVGKHEDDKLELEPLDLSLGLPGISMDQASKQPDPKPSSPSHGRSIQSLPSSFRTYSDGFTTSISISGSQPFVHNLSCSLTQNSLDNYEQSVGSHPIFQGVDQVSNGGNIWQAQTSNEPKWKGGAPLFQRILMNGNPHNSLQTLNGSQHSKPNVLSWQSSLPGQLSPTQSHGSRDTRSEHSKDKRLLTRERSSSSLFRSEQQDGEQPVLNGAVFEKSFSKIISEPLQIACRRLPEQQDGEQLVVNGGGFERIISKIVSDPLQVVGRIFQEMTDQSIAYLKEAICEMVANADKHGKMNTLQEVLQRRSDLTTETMSKCLRTLLEIFVSLKTGLPDFLRISNNSVPSSDLVEIFFNLKCRNLACRNMLPVDDFDCKVCIQKSGFCSACMCLVCSKFDTASNTCSWVGCDVCLHWCHTDCGLRESHIKNGPTSSGTQGMTEMQFHCIACDHPSEMFGFVKDVFNTCAKGWKAETLAKELQYVRRIFSASNDVKGKKLCDIAGWILGKLEDKADLSELIRYIVGFFSESESNISNNTSIFPPKEPSRNDAEGSNGIACPIKEDTWLPSSSYCLDKVPRVGNTGVHSSIDCDRVGRITRDADFPVNPEKKPVLDELESIVRFKQAEAKMYQEHADSARREAEGLKRIAVAKNVKFDEDYASKIAKLRLNESEERRRQKLEELQVIQKAHREYFNMKMRMQADINDLLLKMEATKRNFNT